MLNLCWSITKRFLSVLVVLGKSFVFAKRSKISKTVLPYFGDLVAGWSSRISHSRTHTKIFRGSMASQCRSRKKYLEYFQILVFLMFLATQSGDLFVDGRSSRKGYIEISSLRSRLSRELNFQSRKTLRKFYKSFSFKCSSG